MALQYYKYDAIDVCLWVDVLQRRWWRHGRSIEGRSDVLHSVNRLNFLFSSLLWDMGINIEPSWITISRLRKESASICELSHTCMYLQLTAIFYFILDHSLFLPYLDVAASCPNSLNDSPWSHISIAFNSSLDRVSEPAYEADIWKPLKIYGIQYRGCLVFNPGIIYFTQPLYFKESKYTGTIVNSYPRRREQHEGKCCL